MSESDVDAAIEQAEQWRSDPRQMFRTAALLAEEVVRLRRYIAASPDYLPGQTLDLPPCGICGESYPHHHDDEEVEQDHLGLGLRKDWS